MTNRHYTRKTYVLKRLNESKYLYVLFLLPFLYFIVFKYSAITWLLIAFKKFKATRGLWGSEWVGLKYFKQFITDPYFWQLIRNTLMINLYNLLFNFPVPILLALMINEMRNRPFQKVVQTVSYLPYFVSTVAVCGLVVSFFSSDGLLTTLLAKLTGEVKQYRMLPEYFRAIYVGTEIWQFAGWGSIIYLAALTGVDTQLYEAATIDGATRLKQIIHISLPCIAPVISIQLLLTVGRMLTVGYEKILLLYTGATYSTADVLSTYIYRRSLLKADYSYGAAISLFQAVVSLFLVTGSNYLARRMGSTSLW